MTWSLGSTQLVNRAINASDGSDEVREYVVVSQTYQSLDPKVTMVFKCTRIGGNGSVTITVPLISLQPVGGVVTAPMYPIASSS